MDRKEYLKKYYKEHIEEIKKYQKEYQREYRKNNPDKRSKWQKEYRERKKQKNENLQQRIDKAVEYINNTTLSNDWYNFYKKELLNILKGDDNE